MKKILIVADYNDADYVKDVVRIEDEVFDKFRPMLDAINNFNPYVCRSKYGYIADHNWESPREDLGEKNLYETYPQFSMEYIDEFKDVFMSGIYTPHYDDVLHTIVKVQDVVTDEYYVNWKQDFESCNKRYDDKVKNYLKEKKEIMSYKRKKDGKALNCIPFIEMTEEENALIKKLETLWQKYQ